MRKTVLSIVVVVIVLFASYLGTGIISKVHNNKILIEKISKLPSFTFLTLSNENFNSSQITIGPVLLLHFHPECEHCQWEMAQIFKSQIPESFSKVLLISSAQPDSILKFLNQFDYSDYPSVIPLVDPSYNFEQFFGSSIVPSSYVYDSKLNLLKLLHGEVKTEAILNLIKKDE